MLIQIDDRESARINKYQIICFHFTGFGYSCSALTCILPLYEKETQAWPMAYNYMHLDLTAVSIETNALFTKDR